MKTLIASLLLFAGTVASAQTLAFDDQGVNFSSPVDVTGAGDNSDRLFVVEQDGRIRIFDRATRTELPDDFLNIEDRVESVEERGLLGVAFHPDYATNGYFYVNYTANNTTGLSTGTTVIARFTNADPAGNSVDVASEVRLLTINQPRSNHNAGDLAFGADEFLYIPLGDSGGGGDPDTVSQRPDRLLGKMLRVDVDARDDGLNYAIPESNPYANSPDTLSEIWSFGLRNPWRISFDRLTGDLWIGDVGQIEREEINFEPAGSAGGLNYGWNCQEGNIPYSGGPGRPNSPRCDDGQTFVAPVFDYAHPADPGPGRSVTGGFVYRGTSAPELDGVYICADYVSNRFYLLDPPAGGTSEATVQDQSELAGVTAFGEGDDGNLFVLTQRGSLYEVTTERALPVERTLWTARVLDKQVELNWETGSEIGTLDFVVERSVDGQRFSELSRIAAAGTTNAARTYRYTDGEPAEGLNYYRITQRDLDGSSDRWPVRSVRVAGQAPNLVRLAPNPSNGVFSLRLSAAALTDVDVDVSVMDVTGRLLMHRTLAPSDLAGERFDLGSVPAGQYTIRVLQGDKSQVSRLIIK